MTKKLIFLSILGVLPLSLSLVGCGATSDGLKYPDYPYSNTNSESWEQWEDYDPTEITIDWYVDYSSFSWTGGQTSIVSQVIKEKTGISINFMTPVNDDGTELNTLIAANKLPDVITVLANGEERVQLAEGQYIFPIDELSKRWAPRLTDRIDSDIKGYFKESDGNIYGLPSNFYVDKDNDAYENQGHELLSNGAIVARKDYLDAYIAYKKGIDSTWQDKQATTPSGFIEMCKWVKATYSLKANNPTVCLAPFETTNTMSGNKAINWLMEYFNVKPEDSEGNLVYQYENSRFLEMMNFLNDLYQDQLIIDSNFTTSVSQVGSYIQRGLPFVCILSPQDYAANFKEWTRLDESKEYVPIVLTNSDGEAPLLRTLAGNGYRFSMITGNCARPDRVIRLFDYLWSEEGQRLLYYGVEGVTYTMEAASDKYPYGKMSWTDEVKKSFDENTHGQYGMLDSFVLLANPMFSYLTQEEGYPFNNYTSYINYNLKAALAPYTYNHQDLEFPLNLGDGQYGSMVTLRSRLFNLWIEYLPKIVMAKNNTEAKAKYEEALSYAERYGSDKLTDWQNKAFQSYKQTNGIGFAYPANDPDSSYHSVTVDSLFGDTSKHVDIPEGVIRQ